MEQGFVFLCGEDLSQCTTVVQAMGEGMPKPRHDNYSKTARVLAERTGRHPREFTANPDDYDFPPLDELDEVEPDC